VNLEVPVIRQAPSSPDCVYACFAMLLAFHGEPVPIEDLKGSIEDWFFTTLGCDLLRRGYAVRMKSLHPSLFTVHDVGRLTTTEGILARLDVVGRKENLSDDEGLALRYARAFVEQGGVIEAGIPVADDIRREIELGFPLITVFEHNLLGGDLPGSYLHANVITGIDEQYVYVNDPLWDERGGRQRYPIESFLYAIHAATMGDLDNGSLVMVRPPQRSARPS